MGNQIDLIRHLKGVNEAVTESLEEAQKELIEAKKQIAVLSTHNEMLSARLQSLRKLGVI